MDFTFLEIDHLIQRGLLSKDNENKFGINEVYNSTNQGFGWITVKKLDNEEIVMHVASPINVDPDDASYDMSYATRYYKSFQDFINYNCYKEELK